MKKLKVLLLVLLMFVVIPKAEAKEIEHFVSKADTDVVMDEVYNSSVAVAGESVNFDGTIKGLAIGAGNKIALNGEADYGIIVGNSVTTNGTVNNDAFILGNLVTTNDKSIFKRDAIIAGSDIELNGVFNRNVSLYAKKVTLKNVSIKGNVKIYAENVTVEKDTTIKGTLYYPEDAKYKADDKANIAKVEKTPAIQTHDDQNYFATVSAKIWSFLCLALVFAAISLFCPAAFSKINNKYEKTTLGEGVEVFTKGLVVMILVPVVSVLLCCTMIGIPLGIILILLYGIAIYLSTIFAAYLIGYKIWQKVFNKNGHILFFGLIGLFILLILGLVPGVRTLVSIITTLVGLGLIFDVVKNSKDDN